MFAAVGEFYAADLDCEAHYRNVTICVVTLNHLVGERFRVGDVLLEGLGPCDPCGYMESLADQVDAAAALEHRGGLDARIVELGTIAVKSEVRW